MKHKMSREGWKPSDGIVLEDAAQKALVAEGNELVTAGPGSGKTELLAQKACYLIQTGACPKPYRILAISFKKDSATTLFDRVKQRCGKETAGRFSSYTFDGFAKIILDHFLDALPTQCRPSRDYELNNVEMIQALTGIPKQRTTDALLNRAALPLVGSSCENTLWKKLLEGTGPKGTSQLTFQMAFRLVLYLVETNSDVATLIRDTFACVFLDEYQDTTELQYALIKELFLNDRTCVTAVGDSKQRIMLWAGAMPKAFERFKSDFSPKSFELLMNHRSAPRLVDLQTRMYKSLGEQPHPVATSSAWEPDDGKVSLLISEDPSDESKYLAQDITDKIRDGLPAREICILCKQKPKDYTVGLVKELAGNGIRARCENEVQDLLSDDLVILVLDILLISIGSGDSSIRASAEQAIALIMGVLEKQSAERYQMFLVELSELYQETYILCKNTKCKNDLEKVMQHVLDSLGRDAISSNYPAYRQPLSFKKLTDTLSRYLWSEMEEAHGMEAGIKSLLGDGVVPIMTIHKSKGLEFDSVYLVGLEDSAFWNFKYQPDEDRCAFFVALSRAQRQATFTFCRHRMGRDQSHDGINEFFELLSNDKVATVIRI